VVSAPCGTQKVAHHAVTVTMSYKEDRRYVLAVSEKMFEPASEIPRGSQKALALFSGEIIISDPVLIFLEAAGFNRTQALLLSEKVCRLT
jgi:hypothetical protein